MSGLRVAPRALAAIGILLLLVAAGCSSTPRTETTTSQAVVSATVSATQAAGVLEGSAAATMPDVVGLNLHIASERMTGIGQGARLFTEAQHGLSASIAYDPKRHITISDGVVTTTNPAPGATLHGDNIYLSTGPLGTRVVAGKTVGPWYFPHAKFVQRYNDQGCLGCHDPEFCQRCHPGYQLGTAGLAHPPVTVESAVRDKIAALYPDKRISVSKVVVSGTDGYAVYLVYKDPAAAVSSGRGPVEKQLSKAIAAAGLGGVAKLTVLWVDSAGRLAAADDVPLQ